MKKPKKINVTDNLSFYFVGTSLLGLFLLTALTFNISISEMNLLWQKQFVGLIFGSICFIGIIVGVSHSGCSRIIHFKRRNKGFYGTSQININEAEIRFRGHHPTCGSFSTHIIKISNKTYCAGCTGLVIGALASLLGTFLYFFTGLRVGNAGIFVYLLGFVMVACGLFQYFGPFKDKGAVHLFVNIVFVFGAFLLLVGINEITSSIVLELYLLALIVYWILARIMLSQLEHGKICAFCGSRPCSLS